MKKISPGKRLRAALAIIIKIIRWSTGKRKFILPALASIVLGNFGTTALCESSALTNAAEDYVFTNELGHPVDLRNFKGQALAITFIFTRCPMVQYCPQLSKNFSEATKKLASMNVPTNWHFFSITIDPEFDTPAVLKNYAERYNYDPRRWSFLTGSSNQIQKLGKELGMSFDPDGNLVKHAFRTVVIDRSNGVQQIFPVAGPFSEELVREMSAALGSTNAGNAIKKPQ